MMFLNFLTFVSVSVLTLKSCDEHADLACVYFKI